MELKNKIEICVGIGLDQFTPEYVVIEFDNSQEETLFPEKIAFDFVSSPSTPGAYLFKEGRDMARKGMIPLLEKTKDSLPKKRVRKPKKGGSEQAE